MSYTYVYNINICLQFTIQSLETNQIVLNFPKGQLVQVHVTFHQTYFFNWENLLIRLEPI